MILRGALAAMFGAAAQPVVDAARADIRRELLAHIEMRAEDNVRDGMEPAEARRDAEARFGDIDRIERACRAQATGGQLMLQRIHLVLMVALVAAVAWMLVQNHQLRVRALQERERAMSLQQALMSARERPAAVEVIEIAVGDQIEVHDMNGNWDPFTARMALDGKLLLPSVGWVDVAGRTRQEAEEHLTEICSQHYTEVDVKLVVQGGG